MCAVLAREKTGKGQQVDLSAQEVYLNSYWGFLVFSLYDPETMGNIARWGRPVGNPIAMFRCRDGYVSFQFQIEEHWRRFVELMGNPDWAENELFQDATARTENWDALKLLVEEWLSEHDAQEFFHAAQAKRCPVAPVNTVADVAESEQLAARDFFVDIEHPEMGKIRYPSTPYKFSETPWRVEHPAPLLGQHNEEIYYGRLGYTRTELAEMREIGII